MEDEHVQNEIATICKEVKNAVKNIAVCDNSINSFVVTTQEGITYKLTLSSAGLLAVVLTENKFCADIPNIDGEIFESIYSFLSKISPSFRSIFAKTLAKKLSELAKNE